eukprot:scaffold98430_cov54-Phaeocystis_antarctica.AAC.1
MQRDASGENADGTKKKKKAVKEKKCDSEREEWCDGAGDGDNDLPEGADPINCVAVTKGVVEDQWCANPNPNPNPNPSLNPYPIALTLTLALALALALTPTLTLTPTRCVINCGFTPPNCLKDLCTCPIAGATRFA